MSDKLAIILEKNSPGKKNKKIDDIVKKVAKISKLETDFEKLKQTIRDLKNEVEMQFAPVKENYCTTNERLLLLLISKYGLKGLTKWQKELLSSMIHETHEKLFAQNYSSSELDTAYANFVKKQHGDFTDYEKQYSAELFKKMMSDLGFNDDDCADINHDNAHNPEIKKKIAEKMREKQQEQQDEFNARTKEKVVANTDIDFAKIYKKLAKLTHPDLCKSIEEKIIKEQNMQRLTTAWESRNYYDLLMIWLEIDPDNIIELDITDDNQKTIIKQLNTKILTLENTMHHIKFRDDETAFYYQNFHAPKATTVQKRILQYIKFRKFETIETAEEIELFKKTENLKKHLAAMYDSQTNDNFGEMLRQFGVNFD